jgi:hypothetical protein
MSRPLFSQYHKWFVELGYPELDIVEYDDGEWEIIQFIGSTVVPAETRWETVLGGIRHVEPSYSFCANWVQRLDITKKLFWDLEDLEQQKHLLAADKLDKHVEDLAERAAFVVTHTPTLMERIAKKGLGEVLLHKIAQHVPANEITAMN